MFARDVYFDSVRKSLFAGSLDQDQVNGQNDILNSWESYYATQDMRWLAYALATTYHETSQEMQPIEEYGKGSGMSYGKKDPETGQTYYGRGFVQLTWRDNYRRADTELGNKGDMRCEYNAALQLDARMAAPTMFRGMMEGWFRSDNNGKQTLARYFDDDTDDPYTAREIINGDKKTVPSWSNGVSIGNLIRGYHDKFLAALQASWIEDTPDVGPIPEPKPEPDKLVRVVISAPEGVQIELVINGKEIPI